jgi:hypothetical protein
MARKRGNPGLKGRLLEKSIEAYILALETINCLSIKYRVETFAYLLCSAWELILKAKIISDTGNRRSICYPRGPRRTLSLRDCLKRVIPNEKDPVRANVEKIADLRDRACHLVISKVPKEIIGLFQSSVLNYHKKLNEWFQMSLSERVTVGMMTIVYDFDPKEFDLTNPRLRREMGKETADYLMRYQADIRQMFDELGKPAEFSIDIGFHLALVKKLAEGDIALTSGTAGDPTQIVEVPKDPGQTHPFLQKDVVKELNSKIAPKTINQYDLLCVRRLYNIEKRPEFFYQSSVPGSPKQYSQAYVDWLLQEYKKDPSFFSNARSKTHGR